MPLSKEVKQRAIQLLKEQGPNNLSKHDYIHNRDDGTYTFCAVGAIGIAAGMRPNKDPFISNLIAAQAGITVGNVGRLIAINDEDGLSAAIAYIESL